MRTRACSLTLVPLALGLALWGCTGSGLSPQTAVDPNEIAELKARVIELQRKAAVDEVEIARLRQQLDELTGGRTRSANGVRRPERAPETSRESASPRDLDPLDPAARPQAKPPIEEADIDTPPTASVVPRAGRKPSVTPPPARRATPPRPAPPPEPPPAPVPSEPAPPPAAGTGQGAGEAGESGRPVPPAAQALYDRGYSLYNQGHFVDAEASFQRFLQSEPASDLSDNALYWIGECRYSRGDLKGALAAFRETVERYPNANKVPDALLKAGQTLEALHDVEGARVTYREVIRRFPGTAAAALADERRSKLH
jgi:tol-pal system protein YbgF